MWVSGKLLKDHHTRARSSAELSARRFGSIKITKLIGRNAVKLDRPASNKSHCVIYVGYTRLVVLLPSNLQLDVPIETEIPEEWYYERSSVYKVDVLLAHRQKGYRWQWWQRLTYLEGAQQHDAKCQPWRDFINDDGTRTEAFLNYIVQNGL